MQDKISELHGNTNMEQCTKCRHRFIRKFHTRTAHDVHDHRTWRKCEMCGGPLKDTSINFEENLPRDQLEKAYQVSQGEMEDSCIDRICPNPWKLLRKLICST